MADVDRLPGCRQALHRVARPLPAESVGGCRGDVGPARARADEIAHWAAPGGLTQPFDRARVHLLYGERLRRMRAMDAARVQLYAAINEFRRLGGDLGRPRRHRAAGHRPASHRTVGSHRYRIFPKLGITSRAALSGALPAALDLTRLVDGRSVVEAEAGCQ